MKWISVQERLPKAFEPVPKPPRDERGRAERRNV